MTSHENIDAAEPICYFGVEIIHTTPEVADLPPAESAAQSLARAARESNGDQIYAVETAVREIGSLMTIEEERDGVTMGLPDLFTAPQLTEMHRRVVTYLGRSVEAHVKSPTRPTGYPFYVQRLGFHFVSSDTEVTSSFGKFEKHADPKVTGVGPYEENSRNYALWAIEQMSTQFKNYYQTGIEFKLHGPTKVSDGSRLPERGIAECHFLVMDYVRDLLAQENASGARMPTEVMTVIDIESNIMTLLTQRQRITSEVAQINPVIADQINQAIAELNKLTVAGMHRGRPGVPKFKRNPNLARRILTNIEMLLVHADAMRQTSASEEEIPILEL